MRLRSFLILLFICGFSAAFSQQKPGGNLHFKKLPNGLEVIVVVDNTVPLVTIETACRNGSFTETDEYNGLSHLYEHLFFKANKDYPTYESFTNKSNELDITSNATTREEVVNYFFTLPAANLKPGLKFMNSAIRYPKFIKEDMVMENEIVNAEFTRHESSPVFALIEANSRHMWGSNYSRKNVIGNHDVILSATPEKMDSIKNKYYWPNNSVLVIAGDVKVEEAFSAAESIFGNWKASPFDPFKKWPIPEFKPLTKNDYYIVESTNSPVPYMLLSWHGPDTRNDVKGTYVADVFSFIVNQNGSKMKKALINSGLAQAADVNYYTQKYTGPISFMVNPNPSKVRECYEEVLKQIALWDDENYLSDVQIERAKRLLSIEQVDRREVTSDYSHLLSFWWASASVDYYTNYEENVNKVTRKDLIDYVKKYIKDKPFCAGLMMNKDAISTIKPQEFFKSSN
ncbi:M16 family metallopeptidase [Pedobacter metabolipauper]|uniref:Putative Zn-dependent peptidase n=1 Tax=Pedobacter metabolipauper TaxID=425513 RepID=A0A4R6SZT5_9SPHI|nr:pitrilysin family protein [Pedobacter metabolipauper]TDQ11622.1 putative Zn-dependent peptidase [Pedobacter metabolipauper]